MQAMGVTTSVVLASSSGIKGESVKILADAVKTLSDTEIKGETTLVATAIPPLEPEQFAQLSRDSMRDITAASLPMMPPKGGSDRGR